MHKNLNQKTTLGGTMQLNQMVNLETLRFPEFNKNIKVEQHEMIMFNSSYISRVMANNEMFKIIFDMTSFFAIHIQPEINPKNNRQQSTGGRA